MDPEATLERIREIARHAEECDHGEASLMLLEISELFEGLDGWISSGGFMPDEWRAAQIQNQPPR